MAPIRPNLSSGWGKSTRPQVGDFQVAVRAIRLIRCCRVLNRSGEQDANQGGQQRFASPPDVVNELKEAQILR